MALPRRGLAGALGLVTSAALLGAGSGFAGQFFTPLMWTFYILLVDAVLERSTGTSPMTRARSHLAWTALCSIAIWLLFEAYNLRMEGWRYVGLPENRLVRHLGYAWAFATIGPGMLLTRELIETHIPRRDRAAAAHPRDRTEARALAVLVPSVVLGILCLLSPLVVSPDTSRHLWAPVWAGFIFLVDPINAGLGRRSLWRDLLAREPRRLLTLLLAGLVCGLLWESWNYWAHTKWVYTFPLGGIERVKLFEMPVAGFLGFPPFALEYFALTELLSIAWGGDAELGARFGGEPRADARR